MRYFKATDDKYLEGALVAWRVNSDESVEFRGGIDESWREALALFNLNKIEQASHAGQIEETTTDPFKGYDCLDD